MWVKDIFRVKETVCKVVLSSGHTLDCGILLSLVDFPSYYKGSSQSCLYVHFFFVSQLILENVSDLFRKITPKLRADAG